MKEGEPAGSPWPGRAAESAAVGAVFLVAALALTWPLAVHLTSHVPSDGGDAPYFLWNLWWVRHALVDLGQSPLSTDYILYPQQISLVFHTLTLLNGLVALPLLSLLSVITVLNLLFLASLTLSGLGAYSLARYEGRSRGAAGVAGFIFAFCPYVFAQALGHHNLTTAVWPLPWYALLLLGTLDGRGLRWAVGAGLLLTALILNDYQYHAFALLFTIVALMYRMWTHGWYWFTRPLLLRLGAMQGIWLALASPLLAAAMREVFTGLNPTDTVGHSVYYSADLLSFLTPSSFRWGRPKDFLYQSPDFLGIGGADGTVFLGFTALGLALLGVLGSVRRGPAAEEQRRVRFWGVCALMFAVLALGPFLHVAGRSTFNLGDWSFQVSMPYLFLSYLPYLGTTRVPARLAVMAVMGVALLASFGFDRLRALIARRGTGERRRAQVGAVLLAVVLGLITFEVAVVPIRLESMVAPAFYSDLAADGEDYAILELPLGQGVGPRTVTGPVTPILQYYQAAHGKRILNGHVSRERPGKALFFTTLPGVRWLLHPESGPPQPADQDPNTVSRLFQSLNIRYAVVHPRLFLDIAAKSRVQDYLEEMLNAGEVYRDETLVAYRIGAGVRRPPANDGVRLEGPEDRSTVTSLWPTLSWAFTDPGQRLAQVQISADRDFGGTSFLYWETQDADRSPTPHQYTVPEAYPLRPGIRYYWRVRPVVEGQPGAWSAEKRFVTPGP